MSLKGRFQWENVYIQITTGLKHVTPCHKKSSANHWLVRLWCYNDQKVWFNTVLPPKCSVNYSTISCSELIALQFSFMSPDIASALLCYLTMMVSKSGATWASSPVDFWLGALDLLWLFFHKSYLQVYTCKHKTLIFLHKIVEKNHNLQLSQQIFSSKKKALNSFSVLWQMWVYVWQIHVC